MRTAFAKTLLALIAVTLVTNPVLACCFSAPVDVDTTVSQSVEPPCHGVKASNPSDSPASAVDQLCPGSADCASTMTATEHVSVLALISVSPDHDDFAPAIELQAVSPATQATVVLQIPSGLALRPSDTPVSLKRKLLI